MAIINSKGQLKGNVGPVTNRVVNGKNIMQVKGRKPKQTKNTKKAASDFGYASKMCKVLRTSVVQIISKNHDNKLFIRFTTAATNLLKLNPTIPKGERTFMNTDMKGFVGFDFNINSPFTRYCQLPIQIEKISDNQLAVTIPAFTTKEVFTFIEKTCIAKIGLTLISQPLIEYTRMVSKHYSFTTSLDTTNEAQQWITEIPSNENFNMIIATLTFSNNYTGENEISINNKDFNPSTILYIDNGL